VITYSTCILSNYNLCKLFTDYIYFQFAIVIWHEAPGTYRIVTSVSRYVLYREEVYHSNPITMPLLG